MRVTLRRSHSLDPVELCRRANERVASYDGRHPHLALMKHHRWVNETEAVGDYGGGHGRVSFGPHEIVVDLELPLFARIFRGPIERFIEDEIDALLRPSDGGVDPR